MKTATSGAAGAAFAMSCVGTLTAVSATIARYPVYGGQALRYTIAAAILLAVARLRGPGPRPTLRDLAFLVGLAATGLAAFSVFIVVATRHTSPATVGTVIGTVPIVLAVAGPLMEGRRPSRRILAAAVIVTLGAALANGLGGGSALGLLLALGALGGEVCFSLLAVPLLPTLGAVRVSAYTSAIAAPMLLVTGLITDGGGVLRMPTAAEAAGLAYLSIVVTALAFLMWYRSLPRLGPERAGLFAGLVPVTAVVSTVVLGLGTPSAADLAGAVLVGAGVVLGLRPAPERPRVSQEFEPGGEPAAHG